MVRVCKSNIIFLYICPTCRVSIYLSVMLSSPKPLGGIYQTCYMTSPHGKGMLEQHYITICPAFVCLAFVHLLIVLGFNNMSTLVGHFVASPKERKKRDRRGDERAGQGRKMRMNESEETEEIKTFPTTLTCCKDCRPWPTVSQYQLDTLVTEDTQLLCLTQPSLIHPSLSSPNHWAEFNQTCDRTSFHGKGVQEQSICQSCS